MSNTKSTTRHPRTCTPSGLRHRPTASALSHPASCGASAKIGMALKSRDSYSRRAMATAVSVRHSGEGDRAERVAEDVAEQLGLRASLRLASLMTLRGQEFENASLLTA